MIIEYFINHPDLTLHALPYSTSYYSYASSLQLYCVTLQLHSSYIALEYPIRFVQTGSAGFLFSESNGPTRVTAVSFCCKGKKNFPTPSHTGPFDTVHSGSYTYQNHPTGVAE